MIIINVRANNSSQAVVTMNKPNLFTDFVVLILVCITGLGIGYFWHSAKVSDNLTVLKAENAELQTQLENRKDQTELIMSLSMKLNWYRDHDPYLTCDVEYINNGTIDEDDRYSPPDINVTQEVE